MDPAAQHEHENFDTRIRRLEKLMLGNGDEGLCDSVRHTRAEVTQNTKTLEAVKEDMATLVNQRALDAARREGEKKALAQTRALVAVSVGLGILQAAGVDFGTWLHALLNLP